MQDVDSGQGCVRGSGEEGERGVCARMYAQPFQACLTLCTLWTISHQAPLSMGFSRQEYWSGLPCLSPGDLPNPGMEPPSLMSPALAGGFFTTSATV